MGTISGHQLSTFSSPVNGTTPIDANTVRGNDNTIKTSYNAHDADATIHLQNGVVSARPAQGTSGQMWLATDSGAVYLTIDNGSAWVEVNYLRNTGGTVTGAVTISDTTQSTTTATGALIVSGGVGIAKNLNVGGSTALQAVTATTVTASSNISVPATFAYYLNGQGGNSYIVESPSGTVSIVAGGGERGKFNSSGLTVANGLTVSAGGITVSAGTTSLQTVTASGLITLTNSGLLLSRSGATTTLQYIDIGNTSGRLNFGIEGSAGAQIMSGAPAYATCLTSLGATKLCLGANAAVGLSIDSNQAVVFPNVGTPTGLADGSVWYDGTNFKVRLGGVTKTITVS